MSHPNWRTLLAALCLSGCSAPQGNDGGPLDATIRPDARADGSDIVSDTPPSCTGPGMCPAGSACVAQICVRGTGPCSSDDTCTSDSRCLEGACVPYGASGTDRNASCMRPPTPAFFSPGSICTWTTPPPGDPFPTYVNIAPTLVAADFGIVPITEGALHPSIVANTRAPGGITTPAVLRVISGTDCSLQATITAHLVNGSAAASIGDLDGDGVPEIVASSMADTRAGVADPVDGGLVAFKWNPATHTFDLLWRSHNASGAHDAHGDAASWHSPSLVDLDNDHVPEVLYAGVVYDSHGQIIDEHLGDLYVIGDLTQLAIFAVTADVDLDAGHTPELVTGDAIYSWDLAMRRWTLASFWHGTAANTTGHVAIADFGDFPGTVHGEPEVVVVRLGQARVQTIHGDIVFGPIAIPGAGRGGPPTAGDFDGDGRPEFATAALARYVVFDLDCVGTPVPAGCESNGIRWTRPNQDASSNVTGSSVFDFNGDGRAEAVYADECFTRVYDGTTGDVLFSRYRSSCTWFEYPIILDTNGDGQAEIAVPSNTQCNIVCNTLAPGGYDTTFPGVRCASAADCPGATPSCDAGLCRCTTDDACCSNPGHCPEEGFGCRPPDTGTAGTGNVCRAVVQPRFGGVQIYGDPHGRWVGSRAIWNEHTYSVTNVDERGVVPATAARERNWQVHGLNNFRANTQGALSATNVPDLTAGVGAATLCDATMGITVTLSAPLCNRGTAPTPPGIEVAFVVPGADGGMDTVACTATTTETLQPGRCATVSCAWHSPARVSVPRILVIPDSAHRVLQCYAGNDMGVVLAVECPPG